MYFMYYMVIDFILYITHLGWDMQVPLKKKKKKSQWNLVRFENFQVGNQWHEMGMGLGEFGKPV